MGARVERTPNVSAPSPTPLTLAALRGLRQAPELDADQRRSLREELAPHLSGCIWFTVGVMATDRDAAVDCLRQLERSQGWTPLTEEIGEPLEPGKGPVFLKANQRSGNFRVRIEAGVGEGLLITGHHPEQPEAEDTWGPLPLDLFA